MVMRLWSIHPCYLDTAGLVALWRESLLAQKVLQGNTRGYRNHPQLIRFQQVNRPEAAIATYLTGVWDEANRRGYRFDKTRIGPENFHHLIPVKQGQLEYELCWLAHKLQIRCSDQYQVLLEVEQIEPHPLFTPVPGGIEAWERRVL
jgi:hypothetical protein